MVDTLYLLVRGVAGQQGEKLQTAKHKTDRRTYKPEL